MNEITMTEQYNHKWIDVSYHGSPIWQCDYCDCYRREAQDHCPKAKECIEKERKEQERKEWYEYCDIMKKKERFEYLHSKFGEKYEEDKANKVL